MHLINTVYVHPCFSRHNARNPIFTPIRVPVVVSIKERVNNRNDGNPRFGDTAVFQRNVRKGTEETPVKPGCTAAPLRLRQTGRTSSTYDLKAAYLRPAWYKLLNPHIILGLCARSSQPVLSISMTLLFLFFWTLTQWASLLNLTFLSAPFLRFLPSQSTPPFLRGPLTLSYKVPSVAVQLPSPQVHPSTHQSLLPFVYQARLVDLPASPQCGCISIPPLCFVPVWFPGNRQQPWQGSRTEGAFYITAVATAS